MRISAFFTISLISSLVCNAQSESPIITELITVPLTANYADGQLTLSWDENDVKHSRADFKSIAIRQIYLEGTDLVIDFAPREQSNDLSYALGLHLVGPGNEAIYSSAKEIDQQPGVQSVIWKELVLDRIEPDIPYLLLLKVHIYGRICEVVPEFGLAQKLPYYGGGVVGIGFLAAGQLFRQQYRNNLEEYEQVWLEGGNTDLTEVQSDFQTYRDLTYVGLGVLGIDAVLFLIRRGKHRKKLKRYNTYCSDKPQLNIHPEYSTETPMGFLLQLKF